MHDENLKIVFFHPDEKACEFVENFVRHFDFMSAFCGDLKAVMRKARYMDYIVTAGNSFGLMDGGIDKAIAEEYPKIEGRVRERIASVYGAQMPVGTAESFIHSEKKAPTVIYAPTMQIPMPITGTDNVYLATMAAVHIVANHNTQHKRTIWMPLMGTGAGRMPLDAAMHQMVRGVRDGIRNWQGADMTWVHAHDMHARWHEMSGIPEYAPVHGGNEGEQA